MDENPSANGADLQPGLQSLPTEQLQFLNTKVAAGLGNIAGGLLGLLLFIVLAFIFGIAVSATPISGSHAIVLLGMLGLWFGMAAYSVVRLLRLFPSSH
jgi:hypothetical protein